MERYHIHQINFIFRINFFIFFMERYHIHQIYFIFRINSLIHCSFKHFSSFFLNHHPQIINFIFRSFWEMIIFIFYFMIFHLQTHYWPPRYYLYHYQMLFFYKNNKYNRCYFYVHSIIISSFLSPLHFLYHKAASLIYLYLINYFLLHLNSLLIYAFLLLNYDLADDSNFLKSLI